MNYDPTSTNAMFATILARLKGQDQVAAETLAEVRKTNGRVTRLEKTDTASETRRTLITALVSVVVSGVFALAVAYLSRK